MPIFVRNEKKNLKTKLKKNKNKKKKKNTPFNKTKKKKKKKKKMHYAPNKIHRHKNICDALPQNRDQVTLWVKRTFGIIIRSILLTLT